MPARQFLALRLASAALVRVDQLAADHFDGNRSAALRTLLRLGLAAWDRGAR